MKTVKELNPQGAQIHRPTVRPSGDGLLDGLIYSIEFYFNSTEEDFAPWLCPKCGCWHGVKINQVEDSSGNKICVSLACRHD